MSLKHETRMFQCVAVVTPGESVPGKWVAHCLTYDVSSQADDPHEALRLVAEGTAIAIADDLDNGLDPDDRKAPPDEWRVLHAALRGKVITEAEALRAPVERDRISVLVASFVIATETREVVAEPTIFPVVGRSVAPSAMAAAW